MHESERNRLRNEIRRLVLAQSDMAQAAAAAVALHSEQLNGDLCRALETAIVVCYVRPYDGRNKAGPLGSEWLPADPGSLAIHETMLAMRDQVYAHTDRTELRDIVDAGALLGEPGRFAEQWVPLNREALPKLIEMFSEQQQRFRERSDELHEELNAG